VFQWQGGVNVNALISSPLLPARNTTWRGLAHSSDWLPTVASIFGMTFPLPEDGGKQLPLCCVRSVFEAFIINHRRWYPGQRWDQPLAGTRHW
jgi:arylsulfatase A-like enzyme